MPYVLLTAADQQEDASRQISEFLHYQRCNTHRTIHPKLRLNLRENIFLKNEAKVSPNPD